MESGAVEEQRRTIDMPLITPPPPSQAAGACQSSDASEPCMQMQSQMRTQGQRSFAYFSWKDSSFHEALLIWVTCRPPSRANFLLVSSAAFPPLAACCFKQAGGSAGDAGSGAFGVLDVALILDALTLGG
eukprot:s534_g36.t1